jgi:hypothetical protein
VLNGRQITIHVDFPALADYVAYLREDRQQQQTIDALTARVLDATARLQQSRNKLTSSIEENQK